MAKYVSTIHRGSAALRLAGGPGSGRAAKPVPAATHSGRTATPLLGGVLQCLPALAAELQAEGKYAVRLAPEALAGLRSGELRWMYDRQGEQLCDVVAKNGRVQHKGRLRPLDPGPQMAAAVFQVLSVVTAQYYLHEISQELKSIGREVRALRDTQLDLVAGQLHAASAIILEMHALTFDGLEAGRSLAELPEPDEFWSRLSNAELAIRSVIETSELAYNRAFAGAFAALSETKDGARVRRVVTEAAEKRALTEFNGWADDWGPLWWAGVRAMADWHSVVLARAALTDSRTLATRMTQLEVAWRGFERFGLRVAEDVTWIAQQTPEHWADIGATAGKDAAKAAWSALLLLQSPVAFALIEVTGHGLAGIALRRGLGGGQLRQSPERARAGEVGAAFSQYGAALTAMLAATGGDSGLVEIVLVGEHPALVVDPVVLDQFTTREQDDLLRAAVLRHRNGEPLGAGGELPPPRPGRVGPR